jgi:hypothetical protein
MALGVMRGQSMPYSFSYSYQQTIVASSTRNRCLTVKDGGEDRGSREVVLGSLADPCLRFDPSGGPRIERMAGELFDMDSKCIKFTSFIQSLPLVKVDRIWRRFFCIHRRTEWPLKLNLSSPLQYSNRSKSAKKHLHSASEEF